MGKGKTPLAKGRDAKAKVQRAERRAKDKEMAKEGEMVLPGSAEAEEKQTKAAASRASAARLAQIVNLHIAGYSLEEIGAAIGADPDEVDRMLARDAARYVRNQPQLRVFVRNFVSGRYSELLDSVWTQATGKDDSGNPLLDPRTNLPAGASLEHQDRAIRILDSMRKLHGADAPTQSEVKVEAAPEAVEALVAALSAQQGLDYDASVFDVVDAEVVHDAVEQTAEALADSSAAVGEDNEDDEEWGTDG